MTTSGGNSIINGLYLLVLVLSVVAIARLITTLAQKRKLSTAQWLLLSLILFWSLRMVIAGDRNNFLVIALAGASGIAALVRQIRWSTILTALAVALSMYQVIEVARSIRAASSTELIEAIEASFTDERGDETSSLKNTTLTLRATFDIVPRETPYAWGYYKLIGISGIIPLIRGVVIDPSAGFNTSAEVITFHTIGPDAGWSVGTNILSDIYLDFGLPGIPVLMAILGYAATAIRNGMVQDGLSSKSVFLYIAMVGLVGEAPRYSFDFPIRVLVWGWLIFTIYEWVFVKRPATRRSRRVHRRLKSSRRARRHPSRRVSTDNTESA